MLRHRSRRLPDDAIRLKRYASGHCAVPRRARRLNRHAAPYVPARLAALAAKNKRFHQRRTVLVQAFNIASYRRPAQMTSDPHGSRHEISLPAVAHNGFNASSATASCASTRRIISSPLALYRSNAGNYGKSRTGNKGFRYSLFTAITGNSSRGNTTIVIHPRQRLYPISPAVPLPPMCASAI